MTITSLSTDASYDAQHVRKIWLDLSTSTPTLRIQARDGNVYKASVTSA